jgi:hypothetical protein
VLARALQSSLGGSATRHLQRSKIQPQQTQIMKLALTLLLTGALLCRAEETAAARWEGKIQIPERELKLIVDLTQDGAGMWNGSIIIPGMNVKGASLADITLKGSAISFTIKNVLASQDSGPPKLNGHLTGPATLAGEFLQGGNSAPFMLRKIGPAQVETAPQSTSVAKEFEGEWKGEYEMFGYKRQVSLKLASHPDAGATAEFVVVGKRVNNLPVDRITQEGNFLTVDSHETGLSYEGRLLKDELVGAIIQAGSETPLVLHRAK